MVPTWTWFLLTAIGAYVCGVAHSAIILSMAIEYLTGRGGEWTKK